MSSYDIVILGGGESGTGCAILAAQKGLSVFLSDSHLLKDIYAKELRQANIPFEQGAHSEDIILNAKKIIKSPGIPEKAEIVKKIREKQIPIISELDFAQSFSKAKVIAITGTNGKTTTTTMVFELLKNAGCNVKLGGNIGQSYAKQVAEKDPDYFVLEVSSFQLDDSYEFHPHIAILCNITPDHLDRYGYEYQNYINSKFRIVQNQTDNDYFIYCVDDPDTCNNLNLIPRGVEQLGFGYYNKPRTGARVENKVMYLTNTENKIYLTMNTDNLALRGIHNTYNSMASALVGSIMNISKETIRESLANFANIEHRLEHVATIGGAEYINDSKATNVNSVWYALESMQKPVIWIVGGVDKGNDYSSLVPLVQEKVKLIICLGVDNTKLHQAFSKHVNLMLNTTSMQEAVSTAHRFAEKGDTVLLSPACASFDLFLNYQDRGWSFKRSVKNL
ncbi:MAG: UDP-N-acetylmuramoyl-L-alanine--D-glutamate ligase [Bacteroidia bacterium]|nr:UDP-N-acetylmuramoyl-L-alanine--D-glutamate ligase [Bacteroidia bacterium]